ncbi:MAG: HAD family hydrolase [Candidatus Nanopelagicales bacterium]
MQVVLLDLDRTLVDLQSSTDYDAAWAEVSALVDPTLRGEGPQTGWSSATRACMATIASLPDGELWHRASRCIARYELEAVPLSTPMPGVHEFLAALGDRPRAVVTLLPEDVARAVLEHHGIGIDVVVGRDPLVRPKPSGDGLRVAAERLAATARGAVMVGDSTWDALAAADAGCSFVGVHAPPSEFADLVPAVASCSSLAEVAALL